MPEEPQIGDPGIVEFHFGVPDDRGSLSLSIFVAPPGLEEEIPALTGLEWWGA